MTVYVISDTHIPDRITKIPEKFLSSVKKEDIILHAGDLTNLKVLRDLEQKASVYAVSGNIDGGEIRKVLPEKRVLELFGFKIGMYHGIGPPWDLPERVYKYFTEKLDLIIFGHSHTPYHKVHQKTLLFNPGALSGNSDSGKSSYGILRFEEKKIWGEIIEI